MRHTIIILFFLSVSIFATAQSGNWNDGVSVLKPGVRVMTCANGYRLLPFLDLESHKIGFLRNSTNLNVAIPPLYEDGFYDVYLLMPVKKDGKWGAMDLGARFYRKGYGFRDPIVPCIYDKVEVIDDLHLRVYKGDTSRVIDVSDGVDGVY